MNKKIDSGGHDCNVKCRKAGRTVWEEPLLLQLPFGSIGERPTDADAKERASRERDAITAG